MPSRPGVFWLLMRKYSNLISGRSPLLEPRPNLLYSRHAVRQARTNFILDLRRADFSELIDGKYVSIIVRTDFTGAS